MARPSSVRIKGHGLEITSWKKIYIITLLYKSLLINAVKTSIYFPSFMILQV